MQHKTLILTVAAVALAVILAWSILLYRDSGLTNAADIPNGTIMVQLGAYLTLAEARAAWANLHNHPLVENSPVKMIMLKVPIDDHDIYRLRLMGFADRDAARKFCMEMLNQTISCIPIQKR